MPAPAKSRPVARKNELDVLNYFRPSSKYRYKAVPFPVTEDQKDALKKGEVFKFVYESKTYFVVPGLSTDEEAFTTITIPLMPGIQKSIYFRFAAMYVEEMYYWELFYRNGNDLARAAVEAGTSTSHLVKMAKELGLVQKLKLRSPVVEPIVRLRQSLNFNFKKPKRKKKKTVRLSF